MPEDLPFHAITDKDGTKLEVTRMDYMFYNCSSLTSINLSSFDTSSVTRMDYMFYNCSSLTSINLSSFDTSSVTRMDYMFYNFSSLASINLSSFNTSNVFNFRYMFYGCSNLTSLDLSSFDASLVIKMNYEYYLSNMFNECTKLYSITFIEPVFLLLYGFPVYTEWTCDGITMDYGWQ